MLNDYKPTHDPNIDTFKVEYLLGASFVLAVLFPHRYTVAEVSISFISTHHLPPIESLLIKSPESIQILWTFSIWLESVAILPQLFMLQRTGEAETVTTHYLFALGTYRALYIPNWLFRYFTEGNFEPIPCIAGTIQTILYSDFFWIYYTKYVRFSSDRLTVFSKGNQDLVLIIPSQGATRQEVQPSCIDMRKFKGFFSKYGSGFFFLT